MASVSAIDWSIQNLGGNNVRVTAKYTLMFTDWEVTHKAGFIELAHVMEQEWDKDQHSTNDPGPQNAYKWNVSWSDPQQASHSDLEVGLLHYENLTATAPSISRTWVKDMPLKKDGTPPNEVYIVARLIPHYRPSIRVSGVKTVSVP